MTTPTDRDGFQLVSARKKGRATGGQSNPVSGFKYSQKTGTSRSTAAVSGPSTPQPSLQTALDLLRQDMDDMLQSAFYASLLESLHGHTIGLPSARESDEPEKHAAPPTAVDLKRRPLHDIVCYGIGSFASSPIARAQFALCLLLRRALHISGSVYLFEPMLSSVERAVLESHNVKLIVVNEEAKRPVAQRTLFYMVHCGKRMYDNLLWANWGRETLENVVLIGNSFQNYSIRLPSSVFRSSLPHMSKILPYALEVPFPANFHRNDVFNDTSIHVFDTAPVPLADPFWQKSAEPFSDPGDVEMISASTLPSLQPVHGDAGEEKRSG